MEFAGGEHPEIEKSRMRFDKRAVGATALIWSLAASAVQPDQVRGQVVEVSPERNTVTLRVADAGANRPERVGNVETFEFADDVVIQRQPVGQEILHPMAVGEVGIADLFAGDELVLSLEDAEGRTTARQVTVSEGARPSGDESEVAPFEAEEEEER